MNKPQTETNQTRNKQNLKEQNQPAQKNPTTSNFYFLLITNALLHDFGT